jgi:alkyldihydroxyacetonephosphate synthase
MEEFRYSGESMETSIEWSNIMKLVKSLESLWKTEVIKRNYDLKRCKLYYRISQVYKDGVCFYMYFNLTGDEELERTLTNAYEMKNLITDTFVNCGGSISHHHGIGKKYKLKYFELASYNEVEIKILRMIKNELDPKNIFAVGNAFTGDEFDDFILHKL